jgi:hypothetical protein
MYSDLRFSQGGEAFERKEAQRGYQKFPSIVMNSTAQAQKVSIEPSIGWLGVRL